jgi:hypothetical protein
VVDVMGAKHTPGPWRSIIDDTGGQWSGWPLCITAENEDDKSIVRTGGQWPYEWDIATSQREAVANARLIASAPELLNAAQGADLSAVDIDADMVTISGASYRALRAAIAKATGEDTGGTG